MIIVTQSPFLCRLPQFVGAVGPDAEGQVQRAGADQACEQQDTGGDKTNDVPDAGQNVGGRQTYQEYGQRDAYVAVGGPNVLFHGYFFCLQGSSIREKTL